MNINNKNSTTEWAGLQQNERYSHTSYMFVVEHHCKMSSEQFRAQGMMLALSSGSQIGQKQQRERGKEKAMQLELMHICYRLREPGDEVCACVCLQ